MQRYLPLLLAAAACRTTPPAPEPSCATQLCRLERYLDAYERKASIPVQNAPECVAIGQVADCTPLFACPAVVEGTSAGTDLRLIVAYVGTEVDPAADAAAQAEVQGAPEGELPPPPPGAHAVVLSRELLELPGRGAPRGEEAPPPERTRTCQLVGADGCLRTVGYVCKGPDIQDTYATEDPVAFEVQLEGEPRLTALLGGEPVAVEVE